MSIFLWIFFIWIVFEYANAVWEMSHNRLSPFAPISLVVNFLYRLWFRKNRWKKAGVDRIGIFSHLLICNILSTVIIFWSPTTPLINGFGIYLLICGILLQLIENLAWSKNGLTPLFNSWSNHIRLIEITGEIESNEKERLKEEIASFTPSHVIPSLIIRVILLLSIVSFSFAGIYRQLLLINPDAFRDADKKSIPYSDQISLVAFSFEITAGGSSDMEATTGPGRAIMTLHKISNIFIFTLLLGNIIIISQEQINLRKAELLKRMNKDNKTE